MVSVSETKGQEASMESSSYRSQADMYHSGNAKAQNRKESFNFGRFKCRSAAFPEDNSCDRSKSSKSNSSKGVHKISTPWLVHSEDSSDTRAGDKKKNRLEAVSSTRESRNKTEVPGKKNKLNNHLQSVLELQKQRADVPLSKPNVTSQPPLLVFQNITSKDFAPFPPQQKIEEEIDGIRNKYDEAVESMEPDVDDEMNNMRGLGKNMKCDISTQCERNQSETSIFDDIDTKYDIREDGPSTTVRSHSFQEDNDIRSRSNPPVMKFRETKQMFEHLEHQHQEFPVESIERYGSKYAETEITTPRRRNTRSPSPSRLRGQLQSKLSVVPEQRRVEPQPDREMLMGLAMQRDLDRMSLSCGSTRNEGRCSSYSRSESKSLQQNSNGFFCGGVSSALLCDINDDDELWKYYEGVNPIHRESISKKQSTERNPHEPRDPRNSYLEQRQEKWEGEQRASFEGDRFSEFGHSMSNSSAKSRHSNGDSSYYQNARHQTTHYEEPDQSLKSRTSIQMEPECDYESLMNYPPQPRSDDLEPQLSKEEMLFQMRQAVQKATAQLDSLKKLKATVPISEQYRLTMTMDTECSDDESSYVSNLPKQKSVQPFPSESKKRIPSEYLSNTYVISPGINGGDRYAFI